MKWSYDIARVAGIDVRVHVTFVFLLLWVALIRWQATGDLLGVATGVGFIVLLFGCVVLHEFGHALTAKRFGIVTKDIILLPIGGVARMESTPDNPRQEILVALAGPAVNFAIALLLWLFFVGSPEKLDIHAPLPKIDQVSQFNLATELIKINLVLGVFNLLPAFPMDGGRVFRAALSIWTSREKATQIAAGLGQILAIAMGLLGLMGNPWLVFIAIFIWISAAGEVGSEQLKSTLNTTPLRKIVLTDLKCLSENDSLGDAVNLTLAGAQKDFPVKRGDEVVGMLTADRLLAGLRKNGETESVSAWMQTEFPFAEINEPVEAVLARIQESQCRIVVVRDKNNTVGLVDMDNLLEWINISNAINHRA